MSGLDRPINDAYKLNDDKSISKIDTLGDYVKCFENNKTHIKNTTIKLNSIDCFVSTIFLVLDRGFGNAADPLLFETMIFQKDKTSPHGRRDINYQTRCHTYKQALKMHREAIEYLKTLELKKPITTTD